jgi:hypothetical protein
MRICATFLLTVLFITTILSCSKTEQDKSKLLLGTWRIKSQVDIFPTITAYNAYDLSNPKRFNFQSDGKVYSSGIVTPTWAFLPDMGKASYFLKDDIIHIGDSVVVNGTMVYLNPKKEFKVKSISKDLLVLQPIHLLSDPAALQTIDSLVKEN